ncbi:MAG TPA: Dam family site-specific DNA-(adenine-N6)-methyltransferase [Vicinamibacterales bacterium]|nr:Dam family site-specific DNA-(adenine-N6)-methyltransferase [Vicinamibacterales bacterium]
MTLESVADPDASVPREKPSTSAKPSRSAKPFLKWAGGKRQVLPVLRRFVPESFRRYFEPFLGSGAVFFDLHATGVLADHDVFLGDTNPDLIGTYAAVARDGAAVIRKLEALAAAHRSGGRDHYYEVRDTRFNPQRLELRVAGVDGEVRYPPGLAAMFIYLNRTGFNGLYRLNNKGSFNVPAGRYVNPLICDPETLKAAARALSRKGVHIAHAGFEATLGACAPGDFIYLDPPYAPLTSTSNFTSYTAGGFSEADQRRLQRLVIDLARRGCAVVLSNSTAPLIADLYERDAAVRRAGFRAYRVPVRRAINSDAAGRGTVDEYVITNVPERR